MPRAVGAVRMATEVDATRATHGEVVHHTEVGKLGMVMYRSREVFLLHADGVGMDLVRVQRQWPRLGRPLPEDFGTASVTADGTGARYDWLWYDRRMEQLTRPVPGGLEVTQRSDWSTTHVVLRRLG
jgi:hypothetical protein